MRHRVPPPQIRIETHGPTGRHARVFVVDDWFETEISHHVQKATITVDCADITRATLQMVMVDHGLRAQVDELVIHHLWRPRLWKLRKWWWRIRRPKYTRVKVSGGRPRR